MVIAFSKYYNALLLTGTVNKSSGSLVTKAHTDTCNAEWDKKTNIGMIDTPQALT